MNNLLNKFNSVVIVNTDRISKEDKEYCIQHEEAYNKTIKCYLEILDKLIDLYNEQITTLKSYRNEKIQSYNIYIDYHRNAGISEVVDGIKQIKSNFIKNICRYFADKYNVTIEESDIREKYKNIESNKENADGTINKNLLRYVPITYENIIDNIMVQLDGFSFEDKAANEIKDKLKEECKNYRDTDYTTVKGKKVTIKSFVYIDSFDKKWGHPRISYSSRNNVTTLLTAISHFEQGVSQNAYKGVEHNVCYEEGEKVFTTHGLMCDKAESLKVFQNGKVEITFLNSEYAQEFAKEYCGVI